MLMKKISIEIKWAILYSIMSILWMFLEKIVGLHEIHIDKQPIYTNLYAIPAIIIYFQALKNKKKVTYINNITWKEGFVSGIILSFIIAIFSPLIQYISLSIISPEFFINAIKNSVEKKYMSQSVAESYFNIKSYIIQGFFSTLSMGTITGAIIAILIQTKKQKK